MDVSDARRAALLLELRRILQLLLGDEWEAVYDDLIIDLDLDEDDECLTF